MLRTRHASATLRRPTPDVRAVGLAFEEKGVASAYQPWAATSWLFTASPQLSTQECWSAADPCTHLVFADDGAYVAGPQRETLRRAVRPGARRFGIRLQPGMARALLHIPPAVTLRDAQVPIDCLPSLKGLARWRRRFDLSGDLATLAASADALLDALVEHASDPDHQICRAAADFLGDDDTDRRIASIAARLGLSARQFRRRFFAAVDLTPREYRSILRFRRCVHALLTEPAAAWSGRAADAGFADQSHLIREFRRFGRMAPAEFERRLRNVSHRRPWSPHQ